MSGPIFDRNTIQIIIQDKGAPGAAGSPGPQGPQGPKGDAGHSATIITNAPLHYDSNTNVLSIDTESITDGSNF